MSWPRFCRRPSGESERWFVWGSSFFCSPEGKRGVGRVLWLSAGWEVFCGCCGRGKSLPAVTCLARFAMARPAHPGVVHRDLEDGVRWFRGAGGSDRSSLSTRVGGSSSKHEMTAAVHPSVSSSFRLPACPQHVFIVLYYMSFLCCSITCLLLCCITCL